jgi:hypothetical protein
VKALFVGLGVILYPLAVVASLAIGQWLLAVAFVAPPFLYFCWLIGTDFLEGPE